MTSREIYTWLPESPVLPSWPPRPRAPLTDNWFSLSLSWRFVSLIIPPFFPSRIILYLLPVLLGKVNAVWSVLCSVSLPIASATPL